MNFEKLRLNFSKCNSSPSLLYATTESRKQFQCGCLVFNKRTSSSFLSSYWCEDTFQYFEVGQNSEQSSFKSRIKPPFLTVKLAFVLITFFFERFGVAVFASLRKRVIISVPCFLPEVMVTSTRCVTGHFVTLTGVNMHLIECNPG